MTRDSTLAIDRHRLRMLAVLSSPVSNERGDSPPAGAPLDVWGEWERLTRAAGIRDPESRQGVPWSMFRLTPATVEDLGDHLSLAARHGSEHGYQVIHFACHGNPAGIYVEDHLGREVFVSTKQLEEILNAHRIRLVVLNACETEAVARDLVRSGRVECAIATRFPILDHEAAELVDRLYRKLAVGSSAGDALEEARRLFVERYESGDWPARVDTPDGRRSTGAHRAQNLVLYGDSGLTLDVELPAACGPRFIDRRPPTNGPLPLHRLRNFVGRHQELLSLAKWLHGTGRLACSISGVGGVGKTALALNAAMRSAHRFEALAYASAETVPDFGCEQVLEALVGAGLPPLQSEEAGNVSGAVARRLNERKVLLILDNLEALGAERTAELAGALGGVDVNHGSRVLMTLRPVEMDPLTALVEVRDRVHLTCLDPLSALGLTWELCLQTDLLKGDLPTVEADDTGVVDHAAESPWLRHLPREWLLALHQLAQGAFGHPRLIQLAVSTLTERGWVKTLVRLARLNGQYLQVALETFIGRMFDDLVETCPRALDVLHSALVFRDGAEEALLRHVALGRLLPEHSSEVVEWEDGPLERALKSSLLFKRDGHDHRYDLDPPVRAYLERFCAPDEEMRRELEVRHAEALLPIAETMDRGLVSERYSLAALPEWTNVTLAWQRLAENHIGDERAARVLRSFSDHCSTTLVEKREPRGREWLLKTLTAVHPFSDDATEARIHKALGDILRFRDEFDLAEQHYTEALQLYRSATSSEGEADTLLALGRLCRRLYKRATVDAYYRQALDHYHQALQLFRDVGSRAGESRTLRALGEIAGLNEKFDDAQKYLQEALDVSRESGDTLSEAKTLVAIGDSYRSKPDLKASWTHYQQALRLNRECQSELGEAWTLKALGHVLRLSDQPARAAEHYHEALQLFRSLGHRLGEAYCLAGLGDAFQPGDLNRARNNYQEALKLLQKIGATKGAANCQAELGRIALMQGHKGTADELLAHAVQSYRRTNDVVKAASLIGEYGWISLDFGLPLAAPDYLRRAADLFDDVGMESYASVHRQIANAAVEAYST